MPPNPAPEVRFFALHGHLDRAHYLKFGNRLALILIGPFALAFYLGSVAGNDDPTGWLLTISFWLYLATSFFALMMSAIFLVRRRLKPAPGQPIDTKSGVTGKLNLMVSRSLIVLLVLVWLYSYITYADYVPRSQISEALELAAGAETGLAEYFQNQEKWPAHLSDVYSTAGGKAPIGKYTASISGKGKDNTYVIQAVMRAGEDIRKEVGGESVVIWTTDGGTTWHCGTTGALGVSGTVNQKILPSSCRE